MSVRALGFSESGYAHVHRMTGAALIRMMVLVTGKISPEHARIAVHALRRRHPMLDLRIVRTTKGHQFVGDDFKSPDPVEIRAWDASTNPDAVFSESDNLHFTDADLPYRFVFLLDPAQDRNVIICHFHHAIIDGSAIYALVDELVALIASAGRGEVDPGEAAYPLPPPLEQQLFGRGRRAKFFAFTAKQLINEVCYPNPRHEGSLAASVKSRSAGTRMIVVALSTKQSQALRERASQAGLSTSNLLVAALLLAEAQVVHDKRLSRTDAPLTLTTPLDYRHLLPPPFRGRKDVVSLSVFLNLSIHRITRDGDLIATARELRKRIRAPEHLDPQRYMFSWFSDWLLRSAMSRRTSKSQRFGLGVAGTHVGQHHSVDCPPLRIVGKLGNICARDGSLLTSMISLLLDGRLWIAFAYAPPFLSAESAAMLVDRFLEILDLEGLVLRDEGYYGLAQQMRLFDDEGALSADAPGPGR
jgi:Phthiocerol/phthiodiolone dimycocerosyl transferase C-terminus